MSTSIIPVIAAGVGGLLGSMYLDSKFTISRDIFQFSNAIKTILLQRRWEKEGALHFYFRFKERAKAQPDSLFVIFEGRAYTMRDIETASNRLAHWLIMEGVKRGDTVCLMEPNHPTFFIAFFAISKLGAVPSLINTNLAEASLFHCIKISDAKIFLFDSSYEKQVATVVAQCQEINVKLYAYGEATYESELPPLSIAPTVTHNILARFSENDLSESYIKNAGPTDPSVLIYTSGTTGMPKAATMEHIRMSAGINIFSRMPGYKEGDRSYCFLPLYHSSGLIACSFATMFSGGTIVLARKFSAKRFWSDCVEYKVDAFVYIGEVCRFLLNQPPHTDERNHQVKTVCGNGMRPDVWIRFRERFNIPKIAEFYSATEAPGGLFNINNGPFGETAVGHRGPLFRALRNDTKLIVIDPISEKPLRGKDGFCVQTPANEFGELVIRLETEGPAVFVGYHKNKGATDKKVIRDVFKKGDMYFRSGDLLKKDTDGFFYFGDRVGDTFRWKSENVATTEVSQALGNYPGIAEANVYGTLVPHHDGRAGMAAVVMEPGHEINFEDLHQYLNKILPKYAHPVFLRFVSAMEMTGTFKQQKVEFRKQGIDITLIPESEPVYMLQGNTYIPFTVDEYAKVGAGKVKL